MRIISSECLRNWRRQWERWGGSKKNLSFDHTVNHDSEDGNKDTVHFGIPAFSQKLTFNDLRYQELDFLASCMNDYCLYRGIP